MTMKWFIIWCVTVSSFISTCLYPTFLTENSFLEKLASPEILSILIVVLTVTLASAANIHLALGRIEKLYLRKGRDVKNQIAEARRELSVNVWHLFGSFCAMLICLLIKGYARNVHVLAGCNSAAIIVITMNLAILYDIYASLYLLASSGDADVVSNDNDHR